jgi:hypothetical protein
MWTSVRSRAVSMVADIPETPRAMSAAVSLPRRHSRITSSVHGSVRSSAARAIGQCWRYRRAAKRPWRVATGITSSSRRRRVLDLTNA